MPIKSVNSDENRTRVGAQTQTDKKKINKTNFIWKTLKTTITKHLKKSCLLCTFSNIFY